jgi:hypothetical protein
MQTTKAQIKKEAVSLLLLDLCTVIAQITAIFVAYIIWKLTHASHVSIVLLFCVELIAPAIFFIVGYIQMKSKNLVWINSRLVSILFLILNFITANIAAIYTGFWIQVEVIGLTW